MSAVEIMTCAWAQAVPCALAMPRALAVPRALAIPRAACEVLSTAYRTHAFVRVVLVAIVVHLVAERALVRP